MSERSIVLKMATGLAASTLAAGISGCDKNRPFYSSQTERAIERAIDPAMKQIARSAIGLERTDRSEVSLIHHGLALTEIAGVLAVLKPNIAGLYAIDAVMRDYPGTKRPDPNEVTVAFVGGFVASDKKKQSPIGEEEFIAPNQDNTVTHMAVPSQTDLSRYDQKGWTAIEHEPIVLDGKVKPGPSLDTADSSAYFQGNQAPPNPIATAKIIAANALSHLQTVVEIFRTS